jgi:uncharacterized protein (DUF983 family)
MPEPPDDPRKTQPRLPIHPLPAGAPADCGSGADFMVQGDGSPAGERVRLATVLRRAFHLRCPVCGQGAMFRGWLTMNKRCPHCGLWFERDSGYFLGSIYVNYAVTTILAVLFYFLPMLWIRRPPGWILVPIVAFCVVFPLFFFRYARCLWLSLDHYMSPLDVQEVPPHER